ncbi:MAG: TIGR00153 family protein [Bacteroidetes bacterium]|nr:TIGR00153 family protein [Bacteroidota bacterium]
MKSILSGLFTQSPFNQLQAHMAEVDKCTNLIRPMFNALAEGNHDEVKNIAKQVMFAEHEADVIKDKIRGTIHDSMFLPVDKKDLLRQLSAQDDIADAAEDVAVLVTIRHTSVPAFLKEDIFTYIDKCLEATTTAAKIVDELDEMVESSFGGLEARKVLELCDRTGELEFEADKLQYKLGQKMFLHEKEMDPVDIFMWFQLFKNIGELADASEMMAKRTRVFLIPT